MADMIEETYETEVRRKTVRTSYKIEEVSTYHPQQQQIIAIFIPK